MSAANDHSSIDPSEPRSLIALAVTLPNGYRLAECIDTKGQTRLWLLDPCANDKSGCSCRSCAPHEHPGRLPAATRKRIHTCGSRTRSGRLCALATPIGQRCKVHTVE